MYDLAQLLRADDPRPKYQQIYLGLRQQIEAGRIGTGTALPASRALAQDLGLSRATVVSAYEQLQAEGYVEGRPGAGLYVQRITPQSPPSPDRLEPRPAPRPAARLHLFPGASDPDLFPQAQWARCLARVARSEAGTLQQISDPFGDPLLRSEIARYLSRWRGIEADPAQVVITAGAREALSLILDLTVKTGSVGLEDPGYRPLAEMVRKRGWRIHALPVGGNGVTATELQADVSVLTPSHQFPLGGALPLQQRQHLLQQAAKQGRWLIEDDFDSEFRYKGQPIPAMTALDQQGRCFYVGTFSKVFSHELRIGYAILPPAQVALFHSHLQRVGTLASILPQRPLARFIESGHYDRHIRRVRRHYAARYQTLVQALAQMPHLGRFSRFDAGMQVAFHLAEGLQDTSVAETLRQAGFGIRPLSPLALSPSHVNGLRVGFCQNTPEEIPELVARVQEILERVD